MGTAKHHIIFKNTECIDKETLIEYAKGKINSKDIHKVECHLLDCSFCSDSLEGFKVGNNIKLDVYAMKLKILQNSESSRFARVLRVVLRNSSLLKVAAGLLLVVGLISLFIQFLTGGAHDSHPQIAEKKEVAVKDRYKIDHEIEIDEVRTSVNGSEVELAETATQQDTNSSNLVSEEVFAENTTGEVEFLYEEEMIDEIIEEEQLAYAEPEEDISESEEEIISISEDDSEELSDLVVQEESLESSEVVVAKSRTETINEGSGSSASTNDADKEESKNIQPNVRSGLNKVEVIAWIRGLTDNQSFEELILTYNEYENVINDDAEMVFYTANAYLYTGKINKSIKMHQKVIEINDPYYKVESKWQLANIYVNKNNNDKAISLLDDLISTNSRYKSSARTLRNSIGDQ